MANLTSLIIDNFTYCLLVVPYCPGVYYFFLVTRARLPQRIQIYDGRKTGILWTVVIWIVVESIISHRSIGRNEYLTNVDR